MIGWGQLIINVPSWSMQQLRPLMINIAHRNAIPFQFSEPSHLSFLETNIDKGTAFTQIGVCCLERRANATSTDNWPTSLWGQRYANNPLLGLNAVFKRLDQNHSGKVDRQEFGQLCSILDFNGSSDLMNALFNRYDMDRQNMNCFCGFAWCTSGVQVFCAVPGQSTLPSMSLAGCCLSWMGTRTEKPSAPLPKCEKRWHWGQAALRPWKLWQLSSASWITTLVLTDGVKSQRKELWTMEALKSEMLERAFVTQTPNISQRFCLLVNFFIPSTKDNSGELTKEEFMTHLDVPMLDSVCILSSVCNSCAVWVARFITANGPATQPWDDASVTFNILRSESGVGVT